MNDGEIASATSEDLAFPTLPLREPDADGSEDCLSTGWITERCWIEPKDIRREKRLTCGVPQDREGWEGNGDKNPIGARRFHFRFNPTDYIHKIGEYSFPLFSISGRGRYHAPHCHRP